MGKRTQHPTDICVTCFLSPANPPPPPPPPLYNSTTFFNMTPLPLLPQRHILLAVAFVFFVVFFLLFFCCCCFFWFLSFFGFHYYFHSFFGRCSRLNPLSFTQFLSATTTPPPPRTPFLFRTFILFSLFENWYHNNTCFPPVPPPFLPHITHAHTSGQQDNNSTTLLSHTLTHTHNPANEYALS